MPILLTTTPTLTTHEIEEYLGPVFGETVWGGNVLRDFASAFTDVLGGRASSYENLLTDGRSEAIEELSRRAATLGANAIVDLDVKYETLNGSMFLICVSGTAVRVRPIQSAPTPNQFPSELAQQIIPPH